MEAVSELRELARGLEIDLAVAKAMDFPCPAGGSHEWEVSMATGCGKCNMMLPLYSADMAHAFQVRTRMRELGFTFRLSDAPNGRSAVSFFHDDAEQGLAGAAVEDTDALAICRAALEAVKEKAKAASG